LGFLKLRILIFAGVLLIATAATAGIVNGPPGSLAPHLTANGRTLWNLDALMNDTFGSRVPCLDLSHYTFYSVPRGGDCTGPSRPATSHYNYVFTFLKAHHSQLRLVRLAREPVTGVTNAPLRLGGRYISCPNGGYHHGGRGWLVFGGGAPPNAEIWCN
jgi:hypothetical protein